jgi:hypothetical protein
VALTLASLGGSVGLIAVALGMFALLGVRRRAAWETCEIGLSRRDGDGEFYARPLRSKRDDPMAATSPMFRWPNDDLPNEGAVRAAYDVIVQRLAWDGWTLADGRNGVWWRKRFRRPAETARK